MTDLGCLQAKCGALIILGTRIPDVAQPMKRLQTWTPAQRVYRLGILQDAIHACRDALQRFSDVSPALAQSIQIWDDVI